MRYVLAAALIVSVTPVQAQQMPGMDHTAMMGGHHMGAGMAPVGEPGQGAFRAIAQIVAMLEADPQTDWARVDINALRAHLRDMSLVTLSATAQARDIPGGIIFDVRGTGDVIGAIQRMVPAHGDVMQGVNGWAYDAKTTPDGAILKVVVPSTDLARLKALGFFGVLASGMHHQAHHWAMATGQNPHH